MKNGYERTKSQRIERLKNIAPIARHRRWHVRRGVIDPNCPFCAPSSSSIRTCLTCNQPKELVDNFRPNSSGRGYRWQCRQCDSDQHMNWVRSNRTKDMLQAARGRARKAGVPCTISFNDIVIPEVCPVFGVRLERGTRAAHDWAPSLDRNKPELGYVPGNVRVISNKANRLKSDASLDELRQLVAYLERL